MNEVNPAGRPRTTRGIHFVPPAACEEIMNIATGILWSILRRHRWGFTAVAVYVGLMIVVQRGLPLLVDWIPAVFPGADPTEVAISIASISTMPMAFIGCFFIAAFAYGFEIDLAGRESSFPAHMLTLPARTIALAGWPMLFGAVAMALLWWALNWGVLRPSGLMAPWLWPAALLAILMTWIQALAWSAFALRWLRIVVAMLVVPIPLVIASFGINVFEVSHEAMAALLGCLAPLGFIAGWRGLVRVRRGDVPEWTWPASVSRALSGKRRYQRRPFASPQAAQRWFEWRRHGIALPLMVAVLLPLMLFPLLLGRNDALPTARILAPILFIPALLAGSAAAAVGKHNPWVSDYYGVPAFTATRPLTTAGLVAAKFRAALGSTLIAWLILLGGTALAVAPSYAAEDVRAWWHILVEREGTFKATALVLTVAFMLILLTWKRLVENQMVGLTGREWLIKGAVVGGLCVYLLLGLLAAWMYVYPDFRESVVTALPWLLGAAVALKAVLAVGVLRALYAWDLIDGSRLTAFALLWLGVAGGLFGLLLWLAPAHWVSWPYLGAAVVIVMPLVRPAAAPLALAWNRHR